MVQSAGIEMMDKVAGSPEHQEMSPVFGSFSTKEESDANRINRTHRDRFCLWWAALLKTLRAKESPLPRRILLSLSNTGMLFIIAAVVVLYLDKQ